jgi:hypothetical protein
VISAQAIVYPDVCPQPNRSRRDHAISTFFNRQRLTSFRSAEVAGHPLWVTPFAGGCFRVESCNRRADIVGHFSSEPGGQAAMLKWIEEQIKAIFGILLFLGGIALILFFVKILYDQIFQNTINIDAISVPKVLSDGGYTEGVASAHLRDSIQKVVGQVVQNSRTAKAGPQVLLRTDIPDIIIPKFVIPLESISKFISRYFGLNLWHNLSGDFVVSDSKLKLRLRLDGKILYFDPDGVDLGSPDVALDRSVNWVLVSASPYIAVMAYMPTDPEKARSIARNLADESESKGEDVGWSYNVLGVFSYKDHKYDAAEQWFDKALDATKMYAQEQKDLPPVASSWKN